MKTHLMAITTLVIAAIVVPAALYAQGAGLKPGDSIGTMSLRLSLIHISEPTRPY